MEPRIDEDRRSGSTWADQEATVWIGSPSQWVNFKAFLFTGLLSLVILIGLAWVQSSGSSAMAGYRTPATFVLALLLLVSLGLAFRAYLAVRFTNYTITTQRVRFTRGIFSRRTEDLELYRVDDTALLQPFLLRLVSRSNVLLTTSDRSSPSFLLEAIPNARSLRDEMRRHIEACRDRKKTRVLDFQ